MQRSKFFLAIAALALLPALTAQAQYYPPPQTRPSAFYLGKAHVDGRNDHDDIKVGRMRAVSTPCCCRFTTLRSSSTAWSSITEMAPQNPTH